MSSDEPKPDEDDTGPVQVGSPAPTAAGADRRFDAPLSVNPRPVRRDNRHALIVAVAVVAVVALGVLAWLFWPSSQTSDNASQDTASTTPTESSQQAEARLRKMLPRGYSPDACEAVVPAQGAVAQLSCGANADPGGPLSATYTLAKDKAAEQDLFDDIVTTSSVVDCPGNIQSPGPWRRNATPQQTAGTLVCGFQQSKPTVGWSTDENLMISEVQSGPQGPNMVQLYTWWASHS
jgi:serine/threonine kinase PknH